MKAPLLIVPFVVYLAFVAISPSVATGSYAQTFDGMPAAPQPWHPSDFDVVVHTRDRAYWYTPETMDASHGTDCAPPPATHMIMTYPEAVFTCHDHLMTAIRGSGYAAIYLTPNQIADFSAGEVVISFDVSTLRTTTRDWIDLWVTPYEENLELPLQSFYPDLSGSPKRSIHVYMDTSNNRTIFRATNIVSHTATLLPGAVGTGIADLVTPSATARSKFELRLSRTHVQFGMPLYDGVHSFWWINTPVADLGWDQGVVQLGHHSYNPLKDCPACLPNTWHWDNLAISAALPFTIIRANERYTRLTLGGLVTFPVAAPANAFLRFAGIGEKLEVSFDGGATWQAAGLQVQEKYDSGHFRTYWMPIPVGTSAVKVRGSPWWGGEWMVEDIDIWAR